MANERLVLTRLVTSALPLAVLTHSLLVHRPAALSSFRVGERLEYDVKFGPLKAGEGRLEVLGTETVRGHEVLHSRFTIRGGVPGYRVDDLYETWFDPKTVTTYRFHQAVDEGRYERNRTFEIFPERGIYVQDRDTAATVSEPLDEASFFYFIRTVPLEVGRTYTFDRYFRPDRNPVVVKVLRRERVTVPAGTFDAVVLQPVINTKGIFSKNGRAEIWVSDDDRRLVVQMKSKLAFGTLEMHLKRQS